MPNADGIAGAHLVRYGTAADQKYLLGDFLGTYDQLVINANMVAHMPSALASLVTQKMQRKPFFIDPQTHAFQHGPSHLESSTTGEIKRSIRDLVQAYGAPIERPVLERGEAVLPADFAPDDVQDGFCDRVLDFQESRLHAEVKDSEVSKYYEFLEEEGIAEGLGAVRPSLLVAPYFYLEARNAQRWLPVNEALAERSIAKGVNRGLPVAVQVVISRDVLATRRVLEAVVNHYSRIAPAAFLVWVSDMAEDDTSEGVLTGFIDLVRALGASAPVINLYGGYFSIALMRTGKVPELAAVTHSLEYGESRDVVPVGGGIPVAKFYLPKIHSRLATRDALRAIRVLGGFASRETFLGTICPCAECQSIIGNDPERDFATYGVTVTKSVKGRGGRLVAREYPTTGTKEHCVRHYMWAKEREYADAVSVESVVADLRDAYSQLARVLPDSVAHCEVWANVLDA
jgi:hypothetical protein